MIKITITNFKHNTDRPTFDILLARGRKIFWDHFSTELCNRPQMGRSRPGFHFTKNGGGFNSNGAVKYVFPHGHFVGGKRTNKRHNGRKNMCTEATDVTVVLEI